MENKKVEFPLTKDSLLNIENLKMIDIVYPKKINPIFFEPLPALENSEPLSHQILEMLNIKESNNAAQKSGQKMNFNFLNNIFSCGGCGCKAISKETLNEINNYTSIEKQNEAHLNDQKKREQFAKIWQQIQSQKCETGEADLKSQKAKIISNKSNKSTNSKKTKQKMKFEEAYQRFGHAGQKQWRQQIKSI